MNLKGAFTLLSPSDVGLFGMLLTNELLYLQLAGIFGWAGTPAAFQVVTRVILWDVIVPGPGSRSYRVPTLPDPTGCYYCTLQLGCRIVVAIYSVHLEVKLASSIDTCN